MPLPPFHESLLLLREPGTRGTQFLLNSSFVPNEISLEIKRDENIDNE
jgi:hypothetical protein